MTMQRDTRDTTALPEVLTAAEVAKILRVSRQSVYNEAEKYQATGGKRGIPARKVGGQWRFLRADIFRMAGMMGKQPTPPAA